MADHDGHTIDIGPVQVGRHVGWRCEDCSYSWPLSRPPLTSDECDNCGGEFEEVFEFGTAPLHPTDDANPTAQSGE